MGRVVIEEERVDEREKGVQAANIITDCDFNYKIGFQCFLFI